MAGNTVGRGSHVVCRFADPAASTGTVAGQAICCRVKARVVGHGARPTGRRTMTAFTVGSNGRMDGSTGARKRLGSHPIRTAGAVLVASDTLARHTDIGVELSRIPRRVTALVA